MRTDNELIAEFMGGVINTVNNGFDDRRLIYFLPGNNPNPHCNAGTYKTPEDLDYHIRWDWLMPVIAKCWDICDQYTATQFDFDSIEIPLKEIDIENAHKAVIECVKWYNQHEK